jgi:membrane-bound lytic murein transglycosylase D
MKKHTLTLLLIGQCLLALGQIPTVQPNIGFAGMNVQLNSEAQQIVQTDLNALMANRKYWEATLTRCVMYFPVVEGVLIDQDLPTDFKYLVVQESALQPDAVSSSNAVGFWQFKKETALDYGLRVDEQIDERKNINASTLAAAKYLKKSYGLINNWVSALYSFYLGAGGVSKAIPAEWAYAREIKLDGQTDRYILRFFAYKLAIEASIDRFVAANPVVLLEYPQSGGRSLDGIVRELDIDKSTLQAYNRWLIGDNIPSDKQYIVIIPTQPSQMEGTKVKIAMQKGSKGTADFTKNDIGFPILRRAEGVGSTGDFFYIINGLPGIMSLRDDTPETLARKGKVSYSSFLRYNDMPENEAINIGKVYYLAKKAKKAAVPFHTVREGESVWDVSQIYGIQVKQIIRKNRIDNRSQRLQAGRVLWLIDRRPKSRPIEIVNEPREELYPGPGSKSKPRPSAEEPPVANNNNIPKTPAERKVYTPKMSDPKPSTPNNGYEIDVTDAKTTSKPDTKASETAPPKPPRRAPSFNPNGGSEQQPKVVVVEQDEKPRTKEEPKKSVPVIDKKNEPASIITDDNDNNNTSTTHIVTAGQTYFSIARMYDVTVKDIYFWNNLTENSRLQAGQKVVIKTVGNTVQQQPQTQKTTQKTTEERIEKPTENTNIIAENTTHTVQTGETAYSISKKYNTTVKELYAWNNLSENFKVQIGQKLLIRPTAITTEPTKNTDNTEGYTTHTVETGDTMFSISKKYGVKVEQIMEWNNLKGGGVQIGQKLKIKKQ